MPNQRASHTTGPAEGRSGPGPEPTHNASPETVATGLASVFLTSARWRRLMPIVFITYSFAYLDRGNYSIGAAGGLEDDLGISSFQSGLLGGLFFIGYFFFQVPAANFADKRSVKKLMFWSLIAWGILASAQGVMHWYWLLLVDRFLLGVVEAAVIPGLLVFLMHWFSNRERGRANSFLILGHPVALLWMSAASGYLISATSWRWMFIIEGLPAVAWAFVFRFVVHDRPDDAPWLPDDERRGLAQRLRHESTDEPEMRTRDAFKSWNVIVLSIQYALWSIGVYGIVFWLPSIVEKLSKSGIGETGALTAIPYAAAIILMFVGSWVSDRFGLRRWVVLPALLGGAIVFDLSYRAGFSHFGVAFALLIIVTGLLYAPYGPFFALIPEVLPRKLAGTGIGAINAVGGLGGFVGPTVVGWLGGGTKSHSAFLFLALCPLAAALMMLLVRTRSGEWQFKPRRQTLEDGGVAST